MDTIDQFIDQMRGYGCDPENASDIVLDDKPRYIQRAGDKRGQKKISYCFNEKGGWVHDHKMDVTYRVRAEADASVAELTREERAAIKKVREEERAARELAEAKKQARIERWLKKIVPKMPLAETHEYLERKAIKPHGVKLRVKTGELVIPAYSESGAISTIQKIKGKWKGYQKGGKKRGSYYPLAAKSDDFSVVLICEGFATGATVREVLGYPVAVAFDSGNLAPVAQIMRKKYPQARLVIAADNDCWGDKNTGRDKAQQAAVIVGGAIVVWPEFSAAPDTDWNDAARIHGTDYVKNRITDALSVPIVEIPAETPDEAASGFYAPVEYDLHPTGGESLPRSSYSGDFGMNFRALGYNTGVYYYYPFVSCQIVQMVAGAHSMNNLLQLDTLDAWEQKFGGSGEKVSHSKMALYAANALMSACNDRGVFMQEDRIRGCGAWIDDGRVVLHTGDALYVEGHKMHFRELVSDYTYTAAATLMKPSDNPLNNFEARRLRTICEAVTWENKMSGSLLAGWLVIAPICAALTYRPHIYITGEAESGKSTVMNKIIKAVLGKMSLNVDGRTTEPSIRQRMGYDARPLVFDEAEPSGNMSDVIELARLASTGGIVSKFGQPVFNARFCACFSAINPSISKTSDESRITFMVLKKNRSANSMQEYDSLLSLIEETITDDYSQRMVARTLDNMQTLIANIRIFQRAARKTIGGARAAEQIGTMLAGLYLLGRTDRITEQKAEEFIKAHNWSEHTTIDQEGDPIKLVQHIASSLVRMNSGAEISIGDLIGMIWNDRDAMAEKVLKNYGIVVRDRRVYIASTSQNLARLLKETDWRVKWSRTLSDVDGAIKEKSIYFSRGVKTSAVSLPVEIFTDEPRQVSNADYEELAF